MIDLEVGLYGRTGIVVEQGSVRADDIDIRISNKEMVQFDASALLEFANNLAG